MREIGTTRSSRLIRARVVSSATFRAAFRAAFRARSRTSVGHNPAKLNIRYDSLVATMIVNISAFCSRRARDHEWISRERALICNRVVRDKLIDGDTTLAEK